MFSFVAIPSGSYAAPVYSEPVTASEPNVRLYLNVTALSGAYVAVDIESQDPASGLWVPVYTNAITSSSVQTVSTVVLNGAVIGTVRFKATPAVGADFSLGVVLFG